MKERILMKLSRVRQRTQLIDRKQLKRISKNSLTITRNDDIIEKLLQSEHIKNDEAATVIEKRIVP